MLAASEIFPLIFSFIQRHMAKGDCQVGDGQRLDPGADRGRWVRGLGGQHGGEVPLGSGGRLAEVREE